VRMRAVKTLRRCIRSIRLRKKVVVAGGGGHAFPTMNMADLGGMLSKASDERRETHARACRSVFGALLTGIVAHARSALSGAADDDDYGAAGASARRKAESILAVGYVKCMTELLPMVDVGAAAVDPRSVDAVRDLTRALADVFGATRPYDPRIERTAHADKLHRAALACCAASVRHVPRLFAPHVPAVLGAVVGDVAYLGTEALGSMPIKRLMATTGFVRVALNCAAYDDGARHAMAAGGPAGGGVAVGGNAILAALVGKAGGRRSDDGDDYWDVVGRRRRDDDDDPGMIAAREAVASILAEGAIDRLCEALVGKFLRLRPEEIEEWENDPEGRYETDLAERSPLEEAGGGTPRHCGAALLLSLLDRETDRVARALLGGGGVG